MKTLNKNQLEFLSTILMQWCEDCDTSSVSGIKVNKLWNDILDMQKERENHAISN